MVGLRARVISPLIALVLTLTVALPVRAATTTPIGHVVVIFQENVSFDHYFGTYPRAENKPGERRFTALAETPTVNGLGETLLHHNPNAAPPRRLGPTQAATCDQDHDYSAEQRAAHAGLMDKFVENTGNGDESCDRRLVMGYFDGNTVAALWNYAQHFALGDNFFETTFGPSTPGALNLIAGQTHGAVPASLTADGEVLTAEGTVISDPDPEFDDCSTPPTVRIEGKNVGDLLNAAGVTWGWFEGGFRPTGREAAGHAICGTSHTGSNGKPRPDYIPHHQPFMYYRSTANPRHLPPSSSDLIGRDDQAHHQYDLADFWTAATAGRLPAVSFLKAPAYQDGHAGYSDPVNEQTFLVETINRLQRLPQWRDTAIFITYDDSDGWYDHAMPTIVQGSTLPKLDALSGAGACGTPGAGDYQGRCGYGPRLPLLMISPFARRNFVDHSLADQSSILRFIEDNWNLGRIGDRSFDEKAGSLLGLFDFHPRRPGAPLFLNPATGDIAR